MSPNGAAPALHELKQIKVATIRPNDANPRLHFPDVEIQRLSESISKEGILVPIVVYPEGDGFVLIDGERRFVCARELGLDVVPAVVTDPPDSRQNLIQMFNIHMVREPWRDMPTAWALQKLIDETGVTDTRELSDLTGLSVDVIPRLRHALDLPAEYQEYIDAGTIPLNFFWELKRNVIDPLGKSRPSLAAEFPGDTVLKSFVAKRLNGAIKNAVSLRNVLHIIRIAEQEAGDDPTQPTALDDTLRDLIKNDEYTIDDAYQDTVEVIVEIDKLGRRTDNMVKSFERLLDRAHSSDERAQVEDVARKLVDRIGGLLDGGGS